MTPSTDQKNSLVLDFPALTRLPQQQQEEVTPAEAFSEAPGLIDLFDWCAALVLFVLSLPILLLSMLWVAVVDRGNPIFTQLRIGKHGKPYRIFKIRTMFHDEHRHARFCSHEDDRILPGGQFLRKTRIDELPQFLNVLMGTMALVGPRPEQPIFVEAFAKEIPRYQERHQVKPGITGLAQIHQGYVDSLQGTRIKLQFDLLFIEKRSLGLWFSIVWGTVSVVLRGHGAR